MVRSKPLGVGARNYEAAYDSYDFLDGMYGRGRAVHSSHFQALAENGFTGLAVWLFLFGYSYLVLFRVRRRSREESLPQSSRRFYFTTSNAFIISQTAFLLGGAFLSAAYNDLTWYAFGLVVALDLLQRAECRVPTPDAAAEGLPDRPSAVRTQAASPVPGSVRT
jgi:putative inorganic carbon (HCO3(-)) transporter